MRKRLSSRRLRSMPGLRMTSRLLLWAPPRSITWILESRLHGASGMKSPWRRYSTRHWSQSSSGQWMLSRISSFECTSLLVVGTCLMIKLSLILVCQSRTVIYEMPQHSHIIGFHVCFLYTFWHLSPKSCIAGLLNRQKQHLCEPAPGDHA